MSDLEKVADVGRADVIPGYIVSRPRLKQMGAAESLAKNQYLGDVTAFAKLLTEAALPELARDAVLNANDALKNKQFSVLRPLFNQWLIAETNLPVVLMLSLQVKHPDVTLQKAMELCDVELEDREQIALAVLTLWGMDFTTKKKGGEKTTIDPSTGTESSTAAAPPPPKESGSLQSSSAT